MNKPLDSYLDIVIPTFNRPDYLERILKYYSLTGPFFNFIIADSSNSRNKVNNQKVLSKYKELKIRYIGNFSSSLPQHYKFIKIVPFLKSKYCVFCADDDFIISNSLREAMNFLEKHSDYTAVHGNYLGYHFLTFPFFRKLLWKFRYNPKTISYNDPVSRITDHLSNYVLVLWAVRRTTQTKKIYSEFSKVKIDKYLLPNLGELIPDVLTVALGKVKSLDLIYGVRQYFGSISSYFPSFTDAKERGIYEINYNNFKKIVLKNLPRDRRKKESVKAIDLAMDQYIKYTWGEHFMNRVNLLLKDFPKTIAQALRQLHAIYLFSKDNTYFTKLFKSKQKEDLNIIKEMIYKSNI